MKNGIIKWFLLLCLCAPSQISDAVRKTTDYYGDEYVESIEVKPFSPDDFLLFEEDDEELFNRVKKQIGDKVIW